MARGETAIRRTAAILICVLFDSVVAMAVLITMLVLCIVLISREIDILLSILIGTVGFGLLLWPVEHGLQIRRRTRQLARALVGLPEYDPVDPALAGRSDKQIDDDGYARGLGVSIVLGIVAISAIAIYAGPLLAMGAAGAVILVCVWLFLEGGGFIIVGDVVADRLSEDEKLRRDGPDDPSRPRRPRWSRSAGRRGGRS